MRHLDLLALLVLLAAYLPCYSVGQFQCLKNPPDALEFENNNSTAPRKCFLLLETNQTRCYYALVPDCAAGETSVMYDLHGRLGCPEDFVTYSGWGRKAVEECFIAIWPDGSTPYDVIDTGCWTSPGGSVQADPLTNRSTSDCCCRKGGDYVAADEREDLSFLVQIAKDLETTMNVSVSNEVSIDYSRIYVTGHSNGCYASMAMAMQRSDFVAAVCCMAGAMLTPPADNYQPTPIWFLGGSLDDRVDPYGQLGGEGSTYIPSQLGGYERFAALNGCTMEWKSEVPVPGMDLNDQLGMMQTRTSHSCINDANVTWVSLTTAGHMVYADVGFEFFPPTAAITTVDTTSLAWEACSVHRLASTASPTATPSNGIIPLSTAPTFVSTVATSEAPTLASAEQPTRETSGHPTQVSIGQTSLEPTPSVASTVVPQLVVVGSIFVFLLLMGI